MRIKLSRAELKKGVEKISTVNSMMEVQKAFVHSAQDRHSTEDRAGLHYRIRDLARNGNKRLYDTILESLPK